MQIMREWLFRAVLSIAACSALAAPAAAFAATSVTVTSGSYIRSDTSSSASTGGNTVGSGGSMVTGSQSSYVQSTTVIGGGNGSGTVDATATEVRDDATSTQSIHRTVTPGQSAHLDMATSSANGFARIEVHAQSSGTASPASAAQQQGIRTSQGNAAVASSTASSTGNASTSVPVRADFAHAFSHAWTGLFTRLAHLFSFF